MSELNRSEPFSRSKTRIRILGRVPVPARCFCWLFSFLRLKSGHCRHAGNRHSARFPPFTRVSGEINLDEFIALRSDSPCGCRVNYPCSISGGHPLKEMVPSGILRAADQIHAGLIERHRIG